jgi:hypothetical protein
MRSALHDAELVGITTAWALWLYQHKEFEPDFTWVKVVAGFLLCWHHAGADGHGDWKAHHKRVFRSFVLGGTPIVIGEVAQWLERQADRRKPLD